MCNNNAQISKHSKQAEWQILETIFRLNNQWANVICERLVDDSGRLLTYWRIEKSSSVIILPFYRQQIILPKPFYRHGIKVMTYDFPGGRFEEGTLLEELVCKILERELGVVSKDIQDIFVINQNGWNIDSSFTNQKVFFCEAFLDASANLNEDFVEAMFPLNAKGINEIMNRLNCIQCRCALLEWVWEKYLNSYNKVESTK